MRLYFFGADGYPSRQTRDIAEQLVTHGHQLVAGTGRSRRTACERLDKVAGLQHLVCSNGDYAWQWHLMKCCQSTPMTDCTSAHLV